MAIDLYKLKIASEKAEVLNEIFTRLIEIRDTASNFDDFALQQGIQAYINEIGGLTAEAFQVDGDMDASVVFDTTTNKLTFSIPEGREGEKGDKPIVTFALDGAGNLSYEVTYEHDYADGIGDY